MSWYRTGTVAVTNGSKTVTGVGTLWTTAVNAGDAFALVDANLNPTGAWYEVESVMNNTTLVLKQSYAGTTGSNNQYCVFNMVGNMTTPSFAQRLATFFASFQSLIDKPTATPTALGIPIADANGDIDSGWLKDASATAKGVVKLGSNISVADGVISVPEATEAVKGVVELATSAEVLAGVDDERAVTPAGFKAALVSPAMTGSATLNGTTDNTVQLADIVTTLGLEVGDVIRIQYSGYDKLHSVESITDDNSIIVNYEHAGNRGNGSLKLADQTATVTIKRIAKWYNASMGLGQAWVDLTATRVNGTVYTNSTGRPIQLSILTNWNSNTSTVTLYVNGASFAQAGTSPSSSQTNFNPVLPAGATYMLSVTGEITVFWWELR